MVFWIACSPKDSDMRSVVEEIAIEIKDKGENFDVDMINLKLNSRQRLDEYAKLNRSDNFLKHADRDHLQFISVNDLDNEELLILAAAAYTMIVHKPAAEMVVHKLIYFSAKPQHFDRYDGDDRDIVLKLARLSDSKRRTAGQRLLRLFKRARDTETGQVSPR
jgi:hypothetical protein